MKWGVLASSALKRAILARLLDSDWGNTLELSPEDEWPGQLDDLGDARPLGLWVRGTANLRLWALRSVAVVGARACTDYGAHLATTLSADLADRGWTIVSGAAYVLYPVLCCCSIVLLAATTALDCSFG